MTGATGNIGRTLVPRLVEAGEEVVAVSRRPQPAGLPGGVRHAQADPGDSATMRPVLEGAHALFLLLGGELNSRGESPDALLEAAVDGGVERVVLLSSQINSTRSEALSHTRLREYEAAVRASGAESVILRPGNFASNAFAWAESVRVQRAVFAPFGDVALPVVDPADIAEVAAAALREDGHAGRTYELTGPEVISPRQQAAVISGALGEDVTFVELTREDAHAHMARFMPEEVIDGTLDVLGAPLPAEQAISPDVERVLHRPARPFGEWVARNLPAFR
ncbi:NmrA family transcriptional regulator [Streptomyces poonensis]|uniref:NmrA family transcriptional regulator n=1 Tax=Streptomyces poonensis TaxID=68255 RepID=A0A918PF82_9ACTN|nr:NmrA family transcriptional regulator [Streptomyces poonensis]GLJ92533.1 NmrA family transcriptional regulator [Streptomyces poonensis]